MYKIKIFIRNIKRVIHWLPIIWNDRDWDYYHVYEILKQKLICTEKHIRENGLHVYHKVDADEIKEAIRMIEVVQHEYFLDKYLSESSNWENEGMLKSIEEHDVAREKLFQYLSDNIEKWWD
jgi:hypothetical protein